MYIYLITNNINDKVYVGQSQKLVEKSTNYYGSGLIIKKAIKKYGKENFTKTILIDNVDKKSELDKYEIDIITKYKRLYGSNCYNIATGGEGGNSHMYASDEEKLEFSRKMSNLTSGEKNGMYGKTHSPEVKLLCGIINKGNKYCVGRELSEDTKTKIGNSNKGKKRTNEVKLEMSKRSSGNGNGMYGKTHTRESINKISENISKSKKIKFECSHCNKLVDLGNYNRWHNDNCKMNPNVSKESLDKRKPWNKN